MGKKIGQPTGRIPRYRKSSINKRTQYSRRDRERLHSCLECDSINTRINVNGSRIKCFDCGVISKFEEDIIDRESIWYDLLKLEDI